MVLSLSGFEKVAKRAGVKRLSKDALEELRDVMEELAFEIAKDATQISQHAGRRTVKKKDIVFAIERKFRYSI